MGDRANVVFKQENGYLGFYSHSGGYSIKQDAARALKRVIDAGRQDDEGYGTRIAISELIGNSWTSNYDYGLYVGATINQTLGDNGRDVIVVDWGQNKVEIYGYTWGKNGLGLLAVTDVKESYTIQQFVETYQN